MSALQDPSRSVVSDLVARVRPVDAKEAADQADILTWIGSGAPLFRIRKPDVPPSTWRSTARSWTTRPARSWSWTM